MENVKTNALFGISLVKFDLNFQSEIENTASSSTGVLQRKGDIK